MKSISLGQYYPADSVIHRMDPRVKVICAVAYIVASFLCKNFFSFMLLLASAILLVLVSRIPLRIVLGSMKALIFIMAFTAVINIFWITDPGAEPLFSWWIIKVYTKGLYHALFILVRIVAMIIGTSIFLTYTTSPIALTDAIERLLYPLSLLHVPVHTFAMMMTIALRFIPTLVEETDRIMSAQKARGSDFSSGNVFQRAKALIPVLIPLFVSAFRRADDLATAMECRCYHGGEGRTRMKTLKMQKSDLIFLAAFLLLCASAVLINIYIPIYSI